MENDLKNLNKQVERNKEISSEQNKKLNEIDEKLNETEHHMSTSEKYLNGFQSFLGFFPKLFSSNKKNKKCENDDPNPKVLVNTYKTPANPIDEIDDADILNKNAKELQERIKQSLNATDQIDKKIDKNNKKIEKLQSDSQNILKNNK
jgi:methyl-accepting chemotaxis protein